MAVPKSSQTKRFYAFGPFRLDSEKRVLVRDGMPVPLAPKAAEALLLLVQNAGRLVDKDDLMKRVWPDAFVEEGNLNKNIFFLRKVLGEWDGEREYIETVPKRGFRFVAPVSEVTHAEGDPQPQTSAGANLLGKKVSHYRVLEIVGGGGMGLVYKAEDLKLGRRVALKFLPEELASDPLALQRFEREARTASSLNHPNICTIYEVEEHDEQPFIVMELLEGETLRDRLATATVGAKAVPLDELLNIAVQIATGLEAAHEQGIIHRDIKPANIFLTKKGTAKILDFGLAKLAVEAPVEAPDLSPVKGEDDRIGLQLRPGLKPQLEEQPGHGAEAARFHPPPTPIEQTLTRTGMAMGTAGYMSPEQVRGEKLDARTDLFSFGLVLYEIATGHRAFSGDTAAILKDAILNHTPAPARDLNSRLPPKLEQIIDTAIAKEREKRYQSAAEMRADLEVLTGRSQHVRVRRLWKLFVSAAILLAAVVGGVVYWRSARNVKSPRTDTVALSDFGNLQRHSTLVRLTSLMGNVSSPTFSPDGRQIAFGWDGDIGQREGSDLYVKVIGTEKPLRLTHQPATKVSAAWSPDGRNIALLRIAGDTGTGIYLISATGGAERKIAARSVVGWYGNDLSWSPDGKQLAFTDHPATSPLDGTQLLYLLSLDTLQRTPVKTNCELAVTPAFSPRGDLLAWACVDAWSSVSLHVLRMSDGHTTRLLQGLDSIRGIAWSEDGRRIVFSSPWEFGDLWEVSLSRPDYAEKLPFGHDASDVAVNPAGHRLAYVQGMTNVNIWRLDLSKSPPQARKLISSSREQIAPNFSPDGSKVTFVSTRSGGSEVWVGDADGSNALQLTSFGIRATGLPRWSPDGKLIAFDSRIGGEANIYIVDANGGAARKLSIDIRGNNQPSWSHDGHWIYFVNGEDVHTSAIWKVPSEGGRALRIAETQATYPLESPDGYYVYYVRNRRLWRVRTDGSGEQEVEGMPELQPNGDTWVPTGSGIYLMTDVKHETKIVFFSFSNKQVRRVFGLEKPLPSWSGGISISNDGRWLLYSQLDASSSDLMMENWK